MRGVDSGGRWKLCIADTNGQRAGSALLSRRGHTVFPLSDDQVGLDQSSNGGTGERIGVEAVEIVWIRISVGGGKVERETIDPGGGRWLQDGCGDYMPLALRFAVGVCWEGRDGGVGIGSGR